MSKQTNTNISILSGSISGLTQVLVGYPFDTFKIKAQTQHQNIITLKNVFNGVRFPLLTILPITTIQFSLEEKLKNNIDNRYVTGAITGISTSPLVSITDLLRIRKQQNLTIPLDFKRGQLFTLLRETISLSIYFGTYNTIKTNLEKHNFNNISSITIAGGICGSLSWTITYPIDIIKSRIQSYTSNTFLEAIKKKRLWDGLLVCNARSIIINSLGWLVYEKSKQFIYNLC